MTTAEKIAALQKVLDNVEMVGTYQRISNKHYIWVRGLCDVLMFLKFETQYDRDYILEEINKEPCNMQGYMFPQAQAAPRRAWLESKIAELKNQLI